MSIVNRMHTLLLALVAATAIPGCDSGSAEAPTAVMRAMDVPAAPGSSSPHLAAGPGDALVLSWVEADGPGHRLRYATLDGDRWSAPATAAHGADWFVNWADVPSVVPVSDSSLAAHWLVRQPAGGYAYDIMFSVSPDEGATWSDPVRPHDDDTPTEHGFVTIYPQPAGLGLVWLDGRNMADAASADTQIPGMTLRSATYDSGGLVAANETRIDELICDCCQTDVAISGQGPVAVYRDRTPDETRDIAVARFVDGAWQAGDPVANDGWTIGGCPVNGPAIDSEGTELAVAWFTAANDEPKVRMARSRDDGRSFSAPLDVSDGDVFGRVGIAMLDGGAAAVSWLCRESDESARVCLRHIASNGGRGPVQVVSGEQDVSPLSVPQLARSGELLIAAWTVRDGDGTRIESSRVPIRSFAAR